MGHSTDMESGRDKMTTATSSASIYDNVNNALPGKGLKSGDMLKQDKQEQSDTCQMTTPKTANVAINASNVASQAYVSIY